MLSVLFGLGCSDSNEGGEVRGKITIGGQPVTAGMVSFISQEGKDSVVGTLNDKGEYVVQNPPTGKVKIVIQTEMFKPQNAGPKVPFMQDQPTYVAIPAKYETAATTDLEYTVKRGKITHDIVLSDK